MTLYLVIDGRGRRRTFADRTEAEAHAAAVGARVLTVHRVAPDPAQGGPRG